MLEVQHWHLASALWWETQNETGNFVREERAAIKPPPPAALITATAHGISHIAHNTPVAMRRWPVLCLTGRLSNESRCTDTRSLCLLSWLPSLYISLCHFYWDWWRLSARHWHKCWAIPGRKKRAKWGGQRKRGWRRYRYPGFKEIEKKAGMMWVDRDEWL